MGSLLVVTGPPGAGKSTVAKLLASRAERSVLIEGDAFFGFLAAGKIAPWLPASNRQNHTVTEASALAAGRFAADGYETIFDGILGPWFLPVFDAAAAMATVDYVILLPSEEVCRRRVGDRARTSFSDVEATAKMHHEFSTATIAARHVIADDRADPDSLAERIGAARAAGDLRLRR